jgi:hypothetical protein
VGKDVVAERGGTRASLVGSDSSGLAFDAPVEHAAAHGDAGYVEIVGAAGEPDEVRTLGVERAQRRQIVAGQLAGVRRADVPEVAGS